MGGLLRDIIATVDAITSVEATAQLEALEHAIQEYFVHPDAAADVGVWFRLFERFPEDDAYEMFWSIVHGIESLADYEPELIASIHRRPSRFPVMMVNRMLNAGQSRAGGVDLLSLLESVAVHERCPASVRGDAGRFVEYQWRGA